jgi:hypothetical protein
VDSFRLDASGDGQRWVSDTQALGDFAVVPKGLAIKQFIPRIGVITSRIEFAHANQPASKLIREEQLATVVSGHQISKAGQSAIGREASTVNWCHWFRWHLALASVRLPRFKVRLVTDSFRLMRFCRCLMLEVKPVLYLPQVPNGQFHGRTFGRTRLGYGATPNNARHVPIVLDGQSSGTANRGGNHWQQWHRDHAWIGIDGCRCLGDVRGQTIWQAIWKRLKAE